MRARSRRQFLRHVAKTSVAVSLLAPRLYLFADISPEDDAFLEDLEKSNFQFFWEQADPQTGLVKDRCHVRSEDKSIVASIACTGFALTALCIGQQRGYVSLQDAGTGCCSRCDFWQTRCLLTAGSFIISLT